MWDVLSTWDILSTLQKMVWELLSMGSFVRLPLFNRLIIPYILLTLEEKKKERKERMIKKIKKKKKKSVDHFQCGFGF